MKKLITILFVIVALGVLATPVHAAPEQDWLCDNLGLCADGTTPAPTPTPTPAPTCWLFCEPVKIEVRPDPVCDLCVGDENPNKLFDWLSQFVGK